MHPPPPLPPAPSPPARSRLSLVGILVAAALILTAFPLWLWRQRRATATGGSEFHTAVVERRDFVDTLRLGGTVEAVQSIAIGAPMLAGSNFEELTITKLAPAGTRVHRGDLLVEFDRQSQIKTFLDKQAEYQDLVAQIARI